MASEATIGAPPVPVPPPRPVVTKTMSEPSRTSIILSVSSNAAWRPTSGSAPAPRPLVSLPPNWIFTDARERFNACRSVLATTNSIPSMPASIILLTALLPPPPTPITFMRAPVMGGSSSMKIFMPLPGSRTSRCHCFFLSSELGRLPMPLSFILGWQSQGPLYVAVYILCHRRASIQYLLRKYYR